jgi:acetyl-CoA carboxylase carboxyltransferase component
MRGRREAAAQAEPESPTLVRIRALVRGNTSARVIALGSDERPAMVVHVKPSERRGALSIDDSATLAEGARLALNQRIPLVVALASSGADLTQGVASLDGWGRAAREMARCSGVVPIVVITYGLALSGPALLLGIADLVIMTPGALAYVSGPGAVAQLTGLHIQPKELGGLDVHSRSSGVSALSAETLEDALLLAGEVLDFLPASSDDLAPLWPTDDPVDRLAPELQDLVPASETGSYDVRKVIAAIADDGEQLELRRGWAPQLVTSLIRVGGQPVGVLANQPQAMAGTLDIAASQKGARFVAFCDAFNVALLTLVDTPGFMPGRDLEWRGMIRHGAQLVFAYAEATVPRVCLVLRKAYGGAYIVMDSKAMGNDVCLAWPSAQLAVMGADGAIQILHRRASADERVKLVEDYREQLLNPYVAAERGFVDEVIDPTETRAVVARALDLLWSKREKLVGRKHGNSPL